MLDTPISTAVTAMPIDFDRDSPDRKDFGKLIFRGGLNLFAKSRHFGGYSGLILDSSGTTLLAVSDAGTWLRANLDYDGRRPKGLSDVGSVRFSARTASHCAATRSATPKP